MWTYSVKQQAHRAEWQLVLNESYVQSYWYTANTLEGAEL